MLDPARSRSRYRCWLPELDTRHLASLSPAAAQQARVERPSEAVADEVEGQYGQEDRHPWRERQPGGDLEILRAGPEHRAPGGRRRFDTDAQEGERRLG